MAPRRRFWGWGVEGGGLSSEQQQRLGRTLAEQFDLDGLEVTDPPTIDEIELRSPRLRAPDALAEICSTDPYDRAGHTYGKSFRDVVRALERRFEHPPDVVAFPRDEQEIAAVLDWCAAEDAAAVPYGGGSSVVGGVEADVGDGYSGVVTIDLAALDRVVEVDRTSRAARIQAGVYGPALEDQLRPHGLTLRHFPQSFEFSTLGGWIATRAGGHFATLHTHIDDFVEGLRALTPRGPVETRRLPGSGAGPSPDRLLLGSEGALGIITEAWMRLQERPRFRASATASFSRFEDGVAATRALAQSGLHPSNCRLLDAIETITSGSGDGSAHLLLVGFESADHPLDPWIARAVEAVRDHGGRVDDDAVRVRSDAGGAASTREGASGAWRDAFVRAPYTRDALAAMGMITETFETAVTWDRFDELHAGVHAAVRDALEEVGAGAGWVACRFTHVYPDGVAPYYTVIAPGREGARLEQWQAVKTAASDAVLRLGGTITHHHAVGRDHRPWYEQQRPALVGDALRAAKEALDPDGLLNPGVLIESPRRGSPR